MSGHGHVTPNADGTRARCGGPGLCPECAAELALKGKITDQPAPTPRADLMPAWELVILDLAKRHRESVGAEHRHSIGQVMSDARERDLIGRERYGTPLTAHNGRDQLVDAYQEALDLAVYLRAALEEKPAWRVEGVYLKVLEILPDLRQQIEQRKSNAT